jgi:hypothetical protein
MSNPNPDPIQQAIESTQTPVLPTEIAIPGTPQVFKGATPQELLDQLVKAQAEATQTIRQERDRTAQLQAEVERLKTPPPQPSVTDEKNQEYYTMWAKNPTEATKQQLAEMLGVPADRVIQQLKTTMVNATAQTAANEFLARCDDFPDTQENVAKLTKMVGQKFGDNVQAATADNLELAYRELVRRGEIIPRQVPSSGLINQSSPLPNIRGGSVPPNPVTDVMSQFSKMTADQMKEAIEKMAAMGVR